MLGYCLGYSFEKHKTNESLRQEANVTNVLELMRRLQWFGHTRRREKETGDRDES